MRVRRKALAAVIVVGVLATATAVAADDRTIGDPAGDVVGNDSGDPIAEPRADITRLDVAHETRRLELAVTVGQFVPLDDPAWLDGNLHLSVSLIGPDGREFGEDFFVWLFEPDGDGGAIGTLLFLRDDDVASCPTDAFADEAMSSYTLVAESECLAVVPRSIRVSVGIAYDAQPDNFDFTDYAIDWAPDDLEYSDPVGSGGAATVTRIAGVDRIETAIALSADRFDDGEATAAVLASAADYPDAIAGGPLAAHHGAAILLTGRDALDPRVLAELERAVEPGSTVYLMGGTSALGDGVVSALRSSGFRPVRLAGVNRFDTAVAIADTMPDHSMVLIADGRSFRDGLIAGAAAAALGGVVVLSDGDRLPPSTDDFLANDPTRHVAIGAGAAAAAPGAERIVGSSTGELSQRVLDRLLPRIRFVAVAGDRTFADALAGAPHLAALGGGLLLTDGVSLSPAVRTELEQRRDDFREVALYGGTASLSEAVADAITAALTPPS